MKRIAVIWLIVFNLMLTGCGINIVVEKSPETHSKKMEIAPDREMVTQPMIALEVQTEPATEPSTEPPTEPEPTFGPEVVSYEKVEPYTMPVANPEKQIYDSPAGKHIRDFDAIGYYTIVAQAEDSDGYTWGQLANGEGWTMVYQQILPSLNMYFSSGAGAWRTYLDISGTGFFSGEYSDSDMGDAGYGYPNGTCYVCSFDGKFKVTDVGTYSVELEMTSLDQEQTAGSSWVQNGIRYVGSVPYGLERGIHYVLYIPGTPVRNLPDDLLSWNYGISSYATLPCYALYSVDAGYAFFSGW